MGHFTALAGNATLGALTGGVVQALRSGSFKDGFTRGALGGSVVYAGKRIAARRFDGAGLVGREVAAVGASIVRNASEGRATFARLYLPVGMVPAYLEVGTGAERGLRPRLDLEALSRTVYGLAEPRLKLDLSASLSAGVPVFQAERRGLRSDGRVVSGLMSSGAIFLSDPAFVRATARSREFVIGHERVHVLQRDFSLLAWSDPLVSWLARRVVPRAGFARRLTADPIGSLAAAVAYALVSPDNERWLPTELEADFLAR